MFGIKKKSESKTESRIENVYKLEKDISDYRDLLFRWEKYLRALICLDVFDEMRGLDRLYYDIKLNKDNWISSDKTSNIPPSIPREGMLALFVISRISELLGDPCFNDNNHINFTTGVGKAFQIMRGEFLTKKFDVASTIMILSNLKIIPDDRDSLKEIVLSEMEELNVSLIMEQLQKAIQYEENSGLQG